MMWVKHLFCFLLPFHLTTEAKSESINDVQETDYLKKKKFLKRKTVEV